MATVVFSDGACSGNPGPGGWGWSVVGGVSANGSERQSTNQRMELWAVLDALTTLIPLDDEPIEVVSDSTYVVNCFNNRWWPGWEAKGWKNSQKQPVANQDLWKPLVALYKRNKDRVTFRWVKGHSGNPMNDKVDALAVAAAQGQTPRTEFGANGSVTITGGSALVDNLGSDPDMDFGADPAGVPENDSSASNGSKQSTPALGTKPPAKSSAQRKAPVNRKATKPDTSEVHEALEALSNARAALGHAEGTELRLF